jgi:hypothetical protein
MQLRRPAALSIGKDAGLKLRDQGCVSGQNTEFAAQSGDDYHVDILGKHAAFGCHHFKLKLLSHVQ